MNRFSTEGDRLCYRYCGEILWIEPWGSNGLRVRSTKSASMPVENWALLDRPEGVGLSRIEFADNGATLKHGDISVSVSHSGKLTFYNRYGRVILCEYFAEHAPALGIQAREFKPIPGGCWRLTCRFESLDPQEKIFGMGQYQQPFLNLKGTELELAQRNSQASVPFYVSNLGYGFLWNNPGVGRVTFARNASIWQMESTDIMDYWLTAGDTPAEILRSYVDATGSVPVMPEYALGFWQCKLRYHSQEKLLKVAREYWRRNIPLSVIVVDFFHWPFQGDWKFDPEFWPDPEAMIAELKELGIELMVSVWPSVDPRSENYNELKENGLLIHVEHGVPISLSFMGNTLFLDVTNPQARSSIWRKVKANYYDKGVKLFWLDVAEPEYATYDFDNYRYFMGPNVRIGNIYPLMYTKAFYDGLVAEGQHHVVNLVRCAWAGSQRYGALVWSGDIDSSFQSFRNQLAAGLNMGMAGIPWWTTDIGGFSGGNPDDPAFRELFIRWFEWGTFCPVMRLHGHRSPVQPLHDGKGNEIFPTGADNEVWSFGEHAYEICRRYIMIRERIRPYLRILMEQAHTDGAPLMRPLFFDFPQDHIAWDCEDEYMFGSGLLVAPVMQQGALAREVYLPEGAVWRNVWTGETLPGGKHLVVDAPLDIIPLFCREGAWMDFNTMINCKDNETV